MSNVAHLPVVQALSSGDLALIKRTVAADTTDDEFNLFVSHCRALQLDPRRRQIYALVYNKDKPQKRRMSIIVGIDGFRAVAARSGSYRPDEDEARFELDPATKGAANPLGLVKASVKIHQFSHGQWFPITGTAYWDEFAPVKEEWVEGEDGRRKPSGKKAPDGKWATMPRLMLAKCAEAQALRKAWPDDFSNVYAPEEVDRSTIDLLPSEAAEKGAADERMARIGHGQTVMIDWLDNRPLEPVPVGTLADRIMGFMENNAEEVSQVALFRDRNRHGLRQFWALSKSDALEIKKMMDAKLSAATGGAA